MTDFTAFAAQLAGQYRIERELGRGGFATVFLAHDLRHDRPVALKVLHDEVAANLGTERFKQEVRLAARLHHPHIVGVLDSGESAGRLWFTMPFVEGESLRHRLTRERQLPVEEAIQISREVADALHFAHRHGVVHRDIKPENILLADGHALVADFGIARALAVGGAGVITQTGIAMGTPAYMSPEQASDAASVDPRTDVYSLGCVLYEMLSGEPPFTGPTSQVIVSRVLTETPRPLRSTRPMVTPLLEGISQKAMARVPADRFTTASEFAAALAVAVGETRTPSSISSSISAAETVLTTTPHLPVHKARSWRVPAIAGVAAMLLAGSAATWWGVNHRAQAETRRLAVLPFENLGAVEDAYVAEGITDEVRGKLTALPGFEVTARSSAAQYRDPGSKTPQQIGQELGVGYLLTGTVRWQAGQGGIRRVRVSPELIDASNGTTRWQQPFDGEMSNVFDMQGEIAARVADALNVALAGAARTTLSEKPTADMVAYEAFLRGEKESDALTNVDPVHLRRAMDHYNEAVTRDPKFVQAWAQLSRAACGVPLLSKAEDIETCRRAAQRAAALAPDRPEVRLAMATYLRSAEKDLDGAYEQLRLGIQAQPNNVELLASATTTARSLGRFEEALTHGEKAARLDPRSAIAANVLARTYQQLHRFKEADAEYARALTIAPQNLSIVQGRASNCLSQGDLACARSVITTALSHVDPRAVIIRFTTFQEMMWVLPDDLRQRVLELQPADLDNDRAMWALKMGATHLLMNDSQQARAYGRIAADEYQKSLQRVGEDAQRLELYGRSLVLAGDREAAIQAGERSLALRETAADVVSGKYYKYQVARIYIQAGQYDRALDLIEPLLAPPGELTPGWLRIDPVFTPLHNNPRFQRLIK